MNSKKLLLILCILLILAEGQIMPTFEQFVWKYKKEYDSMSEYNERKNIYEKNVQQLSQRIKEVQFQAGVTKFFDRTKSQLKSMKNERIKPPTKSVTSHYTINRKLGGPSRLDWVSKGAVTSIKDQGFCGSCWAFATAAYCQSNMIINNGHKNDLDLSQQYLLQCTPQSDCKGGFPAYALLQVVTKGIPKQEVFPYNPLMIHQNICDTRKSLKVKGKQVYVYFSLSDLEMIYLLQTSPIIVGVASEGWEFYKGGIMKCKPNVTEDHAVLLVGYTPQYWLIKNQWGIDWGENGYIRITRNRQFNCLVGAEVDTLWQQKLEFLSFVILGILVLLMY